jgi:hypothetical protein
VGGGADSGQSKQTEKVKQLYNHKINQRNNLRKRVGRHAVRLLDARVRCLFGLGIGVSGSALRTLWYRARTNLQQLVSAD